MTPLGNLNHLNEEIEFDQVYRDAAKESDNYEKDDEET